MNKKRWTRIIVMRNLAYETTSRVQMKHLDKNKCVDQNDGNLGTNK